MDFQMTNEEKRRVLEEVKTSTVKELYVMLIKTGSDPEDFNVETWEAPEVITSGDEDNLVKLVNSLKNLNTKLAALE
jgi:hypothetical protein